MKPPHFWREKRNPIGFWLQPLSYVYCAATALRRRCTCPYRARLPVLCVGNVVSGGAGKTPVALALAAMLREAGQKPVFVTRGYGGLEKGPLQVDLERHTAKDVGDEALLLAASAPTWVGRDRVRAIQLVEQQPYTHIILDDGLQNPRLLPTTSFLVIDGFVGLGNGRLIPAGPLRETLERAQNRACAVIMIGDDQTGLTPHISLPLLRADLLPILSPDFPRNHKFIAFAGIGRPSKFYETCRVLGLHVLETRDFPDHHKFSSEELSDLARRAKKLDALLLTTEKDFVRLPENARNTVKTVAVKLAWRDPDHVTALLNL